ncbi:Cmx/CmrA family chloramphenicol efflux MFS transporter [Amycolatopsis saalfeldensis]|uniref:MFS transporter, DHA1 family, chloramphenicol resistance protein n=1 Tax=Amycolatopsis saalfeldensis TaxID=394193 RepID=A0A1H8UUG5_9PSEU|nr:Cmx/CmrA family chloramphenicol efflux MFS transporter [Amycolatopsis saalfeldensis]SEP06218.1 MFS transporter, DHA1 family, chloramphenicol resistance protein [Amycolatopsis saalfeldensis]
MPFSLYLLAVAVFAMGTSEFMLAGLVPDIANGLGVPIGTAGLLTSAFAVGMAAGAPLTAALARRWPTRASLLGFVLVFAAAHLAGAVTTSFAALLATRVVAALANAGFLAAALTAAAALVAPDRKGRALSILLAGTTVATIAGVPGGAVLGALLGWRAAFWAIVILCLPAAFGVVKGFPAPATGAAPALQAEIRQLAKPRLALTMVLGALVNAATFATFTFLAPIVTGTAGLAEPWVPVALVLFGLGSFAGVTVAGRLSDRRPGLVLAAGGPLLLLGWLALAGLAAAPIALLILVFVQGALSFALGSTLIARVLYESAGAPTMGGSYATAALNVGAAGGPAIAAATLGSGDLGPVWTSGVLVAVALLVAVVLQRTAP